MTHPLNKLQHPSTYTLGPLEPGSLTNKASRKGLVVLLTLSYFLSLSYAHLSTLSASDLSVLWLILRSKKMAFVHSAVLSSTLS